jgi:hypothetical protein
VPAFFLNPLLFRLLLLLLPLVPLLLWLLSCWLLHRAADAIALVLLLVCCCITVCCCCCFAWCLINIHVLCINILRNHHMQETQTISTAYYMHTHDQRNNGRSASNT